MSPDVDRVLDSIERGGGFTDDHSTRGRDCKELMATRTGAKSLDIHGEGRGARAPYKGGIPPLVFSPYPPPLITPSTGCSTDSSSPPSKPCILYLVSYILYCALHALALRGSVPILSCMILGTRCLLSNPSPVVRAPGQVPSDRTRAIAAIESNRMTQS